MRMQQENKVVILLIIGVVFSFYFPEITMAASLSFEQAVEFGLENSDTLKDIKQEIEGLERDIELIKAGQNWQVTVDADYNLTDNDNVSGDEDGDLGIGFTKDYSSGFSLGPTIDVDTDDFSSEYTIDVSQKIFPWTPIESDQDLYTQEKKLEKLKKKLAENRTVQLISWLETYLNLIRLKEKEVVYTEELKLAKKEFKEVEAKSDIGEAGKIEFLKSQLTVKEAAYQLKNLKKEFQESKKDFCQDLGLSHEQELILNINEDYLLALRNKVSDYVINSNNIKELLKQAESNSFDLVANQLDNQVLNKELEWLKDEHNTEINLIGEYDSSDEDFTVGVKLSHILYDGGQRKIKIADKEADIGDLLDEYERLKKELELEFEEKQNQIELDQDQLDQNQLTYEKTLLEERIAEEQFEHGLIDKIEFEEYRLSTEEEEVNLSSAGDNLLISKLNLLVLFKNEDFFRGN